MKSVLELFVWFLGVEGETISDVMVNMWVCGLSASLASVETQT